MIGHAYLPFCKTVDAALNTVRIRRQRRFIDIIVGSYCRCYSLLFSINRRRTVLGVAI